MRSPFSLFSVIVQIDQRRFWFCKYGNLYFLHISPVSLAWENSWHFPSLRSMAVGALGPRNREEIGRVKIGLLIGGRKWPEVEISGSPGDNVANSWLALLPFRIQKDQFTVFVVFCCFVSVLDAVTNAHSSLPSLEPSPFPILFLSQC